MDDESGHVVLFTSATALIAALSFQLVARRYERGSTPITTTQPITHWSAVFGEEVLAAAILGCNDPMTDCEPAKSAGDRVGSPAHRLDRVCKAAPAGITAPPQRAGRFSTNASMPSAASGSSRLQAIDSPAVA